MTTTDPASDVRVLVEARFPGVELESEIQGWAFLERFEDGVSAFKAIGSPSAQDFRWVGVCFYQLVRDAEALESLYAAIAGQDEGARVNVAHLLPFLERGDEASQELGRVDQSRLTAYDQALYYRVLSIREENTGNLSEALRAAEEAWRRIQGLPEYPILAPSVLAQLAVLHGRIGRSQRALWFLERGLSSTSGIESLKVRLRRAAVLVGLGRFQEAHLELESLDLIHAPENCQGERNFLLGEIALADGNTRSAISKYVQTIGIAQRLRFNYEELLSRLALVCIHGSQGDFSAAQEHLSRAQELISDKADRLVFRFREVLFMLWQGRYKPSHAMEELDALIHAFGDMGLLQEQAAVKLHKADLLRKLGKSEFTVELDALQALSVTLQNPSFLAREWALLPELQKLAQETHPRIAGSTTTVLEVFTLGEERVTVDGKPLNIPLRRGVEVLAYLLEKKAVTLQNVMDDVFPNDNPRSAKSYFHQFRHQLREHLEGLEIEYDSEAKMYRLTSEINVLWDVAELRSGRSMGSKGVFLPESKNEWARVVDADLERYRSMKPGGPPPAVSRPPPAQPLAPRAPSTSQFFIYDDDGELESDSEGDTGPSHEVVEK